eukprot:775528-Amphidinium_carterae.1
MTEQQSQLFAKHLSWPRRHVKLKPSFQHEPGRRKTAISYHAMSPRSSLSDPDQEAFLIGTSSTLLVPFSPFPIAYVMGCLGSGVDLVLLCFCCMSTVFTEINDCDALRCGDQNCSRQHNYNSAQEQ